MLLISYGTRPEYIKIKPIIDAMLLAGLPFKTLFTGQHVDMVNTNSDFTIKIENGINRLDTIISSTMNSIDYKKEGITAVMVQGDTTSALGVALSAFQNQIPIVHLEAGLRTYNLKQPFPEEANRQIISRITHLHLCPTELSKLNLVKEKIGGKIKVVGNTVLDNLKNIKINTQKKVLVTMHRRENFLNMERWFTEIDSLAAKMPDYEFLLPIHPNPEIKKHQNIFKFVRVIKHLDHDKLINYLSSCSSVITDSGGLQEESAFLKKPCLVCREETERKEGLGNFSLLCRDPNNLETRFLELKELKMQGDCPYGDGNAAKKIVKELELII